MVVRFKETAVRLGPLVLVNTLLCVELTELDEKNNQLYLSSLDTFQSTYIPVSGLV